MNDNKLYLFENFLSAAECRAYLRQVPALSTRDFRDMSWRDRTINITFDPITIRVVNFFNEYFKTDNIEVDDAEIQLWPVGIESYMHVHDRDDRKCSKWNSLIYLNDNYDGGEFFTPTDEIKPKPGLLTFFNGRSLPHGVRPVKLNHRYTMIFWLNDKSEKQHV